MKKTQRKFSKGSRTTSKNCLSERAHAVKSIEENSRGSAHEEFLQQKNPLPYLPKELRRRVLKIIGSEFTGYQDVAESKLTAMQEVELLKQLEKEEDVDVAHVEETLNLKEKLAKELDMDSESLDFELKLESYLPEFKSKEKQRNWLMKYLGKPRKERVTWRSKLYQMERSIWEKSLEEQAEQLMDASAERFTSWLNSLSSNHDSDMTKEQLKALFSIEGEEKFLSSMTIQAKEIKSLPKAIADKLQMHDKSLEARYESYLKNRFEVIPKQAPKVVFGRTVPLAERPWTPYERDEPLRSVLPYDMLTGQELFKGISHLRSTKELIDFLRKFPSIHKPQYLVQSNLFEKKDSIKTKTEAVPLYELLGLKY